jgi:ketol-acid reductoisomerase
MARYFTDSEVDSSIILNLKVALIGYGNQGHAHALNLRDSGVKVTVGSYEGSKSGAAAREAGFEVLPTIQACKAADVIVMSVPDVPMGDIFRKDVLPALRPGHIVDFVHGFNIHFGLIEPPKDIDVIMVAPKGAGYGVRSEYVRGHGVPGLIAVHQDYSGKAWQTALSYAWGLGCSRAMLMETTFRQETVSDLFGEQAVLCGGIIECIKAGFETLVAGGYDLEAAYFECVHETKLIVDLLVAKGLHGLRKGISDTAEWGGYVAGPRVINEESREAMRQLLREIEDGTFTREWIEENRIGTPNMLQARQIEAESQLEKVGTDLRPRFMK